MKPVIYISGPITQGDRINHLAAFHHAHRELLRLRLAVINPGLTMLLPFAWDGTITHQDWVDADLPLVGKSDAVLRLRGASGGADAECDWAAMNNIPVFVVPDNTQFGIMEGARLVHEHFGGGQ